MSAPSSNVTLSGNLCSLDALANRIVSFLVQAHAMIIHLKTLDLLVTEVGIVSVVTAQVAIIRRCGTEKDGGGQVIAAIFEELIHLTRYTRLNSHSVT